MGTLLAVRGLWLRGRRTVANVPPNVTARQLRELLCQAGEVTAVVIPRDRRTGRHGGVATGDAADEAGAREIVRAFDGYAMDTWVLRVEPLQSGRRARRPRLATAELGKEVPSG